MKVLIILGIIAHLVLWGCSIKKSPDSDLLDQNSESRLIKEDGEYYVLGGDIYLDKDDPYHSRLIDMLLDRPHPLGGHYAENLVRHWPNGKIPYYFYNKHEFSDDEVKNILYSMGVLEGVCDIEYIESSPGDYVYKIFKSKDPEIGGRSTVGYVKDAFFEFVENSKPAILHELMHGLGMFHEHQRWDRDYHVTIHKENINSKYEEYFQIIPRRFNNALYSESFGEYDYNSLMHYPEKAFSRNGKITIDGRGHAIGKGKKLSTIDAYTLRAMYSPYRKPIPWLVEKSDLFGIADIAGNLVSGDFDGDQYDDIAVLPTGASAYVMLSMARLHAKRFKESRLWWSKNTTRSYKMKDTIVAGDFNGDGADEIAMPYTDISPFVPSKIYLLNKKDQIEGFDLQQWWTGSFNFYKVQKKIVAGFFNNDRYEDIAVFIIDQTDENPRNWYAACHVFLSNGYKFIHQNHPWWSKSNFRMNPDGMVVAGDFDANGFTDIAMFGYHPNHGRQVGNVLLGGRNSSFREETNWWYDQNDAYDMKPGYIFTANFDGDTKDDVIFFESHTKDFAILHFLHTPQYNSGFSITNRNSREILKFDISTIRNQMVTGDFNNDKKVDIVGIRLEPTNYGLRNFETFIAR